MRPARDTDSDTPAERRDILPAGCMAGRTPLLDPSTMSKQPVRGTGHRTLASLCTVRCTGVRTLWPVRRMRNIELVLRKEYYIRRSLNTWVHTAARTRGPA